jgi:ribonuclease P protein subunit RPR2
VIRLLLCDDSEHARRAMRELLSEHSAIDVVGEAADGVEAVAEAVALQPDVVLMDVSMPLLDSVEATRRVRRLVPSASVVAWPGTDEVEAVAAMLDAGAAGYYVKGGQAWELERVVLGGFDPLLRLARGLAGSHEPGGASELLARDLFAVTEAAVVAVYEIDHDGAARLAAAAGPRASSVEAASAVVDRALRVRALVEAYEDELGQLWQADSAPERALVVPLVFHGEALGAVLVVLDEETPRELDRTFLTAAADLAAAALASERRLAMTFAEARRDPLTGLPNRRAFDEQLERAVERARAEGGAVAVAVFDLDDFKRINDTSGHPAGDEVLREVARVALRSLRIDEEVFRFGGDEFAFISESGGDAAARVARRFQRELARQQRGRHLPSTSVGIASFPQDADTHRDLMRKADIALYAAKSSGKSRIVDFAHGRSDSPAAPRRRARAEMGLAAAPEQPVRVLVVDDDPTLRLLLRTTFEDAAIKVEEAHTAENAEEMVMADPPTVVVADVGLPGRDGLSLCRRLKADPRTQDVRIIVLTGAKAATNERAREAGADALLRKPFSPLELLALIDQLGVGRTESGLRPVAGDVPEEQLLLYAHDLRRLLETERKQRALLQQAYRQTMTALATALETKDTATADHSERVQRYALELARVIDPSLLDDPSLEYGFLLHDIGKIGVPEHILRKPGPLTHAERELVQTHTILGEQMLAGLTLLQGAGLQVVRNHHERWDGEGYPDRLSRDQIPLGARIFAVADTLDAITSDRAYRAAREWSTAAAEIRRQAGTQFDPAIVDAFNDAESRLRVTRTQATAA